ncbi:hypothetical protein C8T65DRAFT_188287 [Cerioporus squamosus]|nr:hypothetical protein C8T65DRAFT_188287 [Cerioporus squamosus]
MDDLAPELLDNIFTSACTDGGFTGCSLSSVSKHIRATSRAARFLSISLTGSPLQLAQFLSCFIAECSSPAIRTPNMRHLYLVAMKNKKPWRASDQARPELRHIAEEAAKYVEDVTTLFRLVARDLETLCLVHMNGWMRLVQLSNVGCPAGGFPLLRELALVGADPFVAVDTALSPFYPKLKRLHIGIPAYPRAAWDIRYDAWATRAPGLTHLCLSEVRAVSPAMEDLVGDATPLKNLRHLLLRPVGPPVGARCGGPSQQHGDMLEALNLFCESAAIHAEVMPNEKHHQGWVAKAKQEWQDRLEGGPGCWLMSEAAGLGRARREGGS